VDNGKTESKHPDSTAKSGTDEAGRHTLELHPNDFELAGGLLDASPLLFSPNLPNAHSPSPAATTSGHGVIYPTNPFNAHASQQLPPPPYVIYPVHPFNPHTNQPTPPPLVGSYFPSAMYPATGPSPDALLSLLRMDSRYANLVNYAPISLAPQQQQFGYAFQTGAPYPGTPIFPQAAAMPPTGTHPQGPGAPK
jgi:hypothetical protein